MNRANDHAQSESFVRLTQRRNYPARVRCLFVVVLSIAVPQARAATCNLNVQAVNFGIYDTFSTVALNGVGNVSVTCDANTSYTISLSPGNGSYISRTMMSGTHELNYNLYTDPSRTIVWGDGTGSTATVTGSGTSKDHTIYGAIPARQNAHVGSYADNVTVTLVF